MCIYVMYTVGYHSRLYSVVFEIYILHINKQIMIQIVIGKMCVGPRIYPNTSICVNI